MVLVEALIEVAEAHWKVGASDYANQAARRANRPLDFSGCSVAS